MKPAVSPFPAPSQVQLQGLLGEALDANLRGRLSHFIEDEHSPAIALFSPEHKCCNHEGDWYGEHAGKWLYAAARAASRSADSAIPLHVQRVADYLVSVQEADGYLGTYAPERRFVQKQPRGPRTWDGAPGKRTWDIWTHSYLIIGLLEVHKYFPNDRYLAAARKIGDLCLQALTSGGIDITELGNHHGMSATILLDPAAELYLRTGEPRYLQLAELIVEQADARPELNLLTQASSGVDAAEIATGKAYQLCWNMVGMAKLHRATGKQQYLDAVRNVWRSVREYHLTLGGGPWGGVAHRSREVFNHHGAFSPYGYIETCSTLAWMQMNRELLAITGEAQFAEEIERSAYNDLLAAQAPNGEDWCYYIFPNGKRVYTTYWRCCKSSGSMALEELPGVAFTQRAADEIAVNIYGPGTASLDTASAGRVLLTQQTAYPADGAVSIAVQPERAGRFTLALRIPSWADGASVMVNGTAAGSARPGEYLRVEREWQAGDVVELSLPMVPRLHRKLSQNTQESLAPDGSPVAQQVMRYEYAAITRGPLVYATGLIDGFKTEETVILAEGDALSMAPDALPQDANGPAIRLKLASRGDLIFVPYYEAGGRRDGTWRLTWLQLAPPL
ncbi:glycoside hydrolase family 127 protein [Massilia endophytica]|uniref:glycoside hydrolase family 127 protein n=1 Tax=Massilia endophytica TaxID=2899220 RepID=UPI001E54661D|nr:beta-L-arabinofuranosidase domain-containing protein [Massilia endophytica]UGQ46723.1 glycoside hydrolase family 127 protein [Massilia endophytica]